MTVGEWLKQSEAALAKAGISTARLDAMILLEDTLGIDRAKILAEQEFVISAGKLTTLNNLLKKRGHHIPLAYLRGHTEFYGRDFLLTPAVLEPRPESEAMIDELKRLPDLPSQPLIADVGTGSGALGITAYLELDNATVELIDIDREALKVAKTNVDKFTLNLKLLESDLFQANQAEYDVLLCNLPYVPDRYVINTAAGHEPELAIFGGQDGLDLYRKLFNQVSQRQNKPLYILTESLPTQHKDLTAIGINCGYEMTSENDFIVVYKRTQ